MSRIPSDEILDRMESVLNIASDFTRLKIMYAIMKEEKSVSEIVEEVGASQSLVSHQLSVLKNADLVSTRKDGTKVFYRLADEHVDMLLKIVYEHVSEKE
jgi:DNA-binding transcriptional ArsR family regulator